MRCLLDVALAERGIREIPGRLDNARIVEYLMTTTYPIPFHHIDEIPWCSAFVNWCCVQCNIPGTNSAWSQSWIEDDWGVECDEEVGAVVVFQWNPNSGHTAIIKDVAADGIYCVGGNQRNSVCISFFGRTYIRGYRKAA